MALVFFMDLLYVGPRPDSTYSEYETLSIVTFLIIASRSLNVTVRKNKYTVEQTFQKLVYFIVQYTKYELCYLIL